MEEIKLKMIGPIGLVGEKNIFNIPETNSSGIYFFTFKIEDRYLIEYVGITTRNFNTRFLEHVRELSSGGYKLYDFEKMKNGEEFVVFNGRYGKDADNIVTFLNNYKNYSQIIENHIHELNIFLIPLDKEKRILERIEGKLYQILKEKNDQKIMTFIKGVISKPRYENENPINVKIGENPLSLEIPDNFEI
jgi:hypothetical protein